MMRHTTRPRRASRSLSLALVVLSLVGAGCGLPNDPEQTLERVRGGTLRVGVADNDPWVKDASTDPTGVEVRIVERLAEELDATVEWFPGNVEELAGAIHVREIDLLIGGLTSTASITKEAALTHPYLTTQTVVAVPPGFTRQEDITGVEVAVESGTEVAGILEKTDAHPVRVADVTTHDGPVAIAGYLVDDLDLEDTGVRLDESDHVMAVAKGENAWLVEIERFLLRNHDLIVQILEEEDL